MNTVIVQSVKFHVKHFHTEMKMIIEAAITC